jgi:hypothetical protein
MLVRVVSSFVLLLLASLLGAGAVAVARIDRLERIGLVLFHVVVACVGAAGSLASGLGAVWLDDGRALVASAAGPFVALLTRVDGRQKIGDRLVSAWSAALLLAGIGAQASLLLRSPHGGVEAVVAGAAVVGSALLLLRDGLGRWHEAKGALGRTLAEADIVATALLLLSGALALLVPPGASLDGTLLSAPWALALATAAAWATAARAGRSPPDRRDVVAVVVGVALVGIVAPLAVLPAVAAAFAIAVALGRSLWPSSVRTRPRPSAAVGTTGIAAIDDGRAPGAMAAFYADGALRAVGRPRVVARTPARRILEAAVDRAQRARSPGDGRVNVEIVAVDADAEVDGDAGELADALGALLDTAMRGQGNPHRVVVAVRTSAQQVSFELSEGAETTAGALQALPFDGGDNDRVDAAALAARARLSVERHGGSLLVRPGPRGPVVHVTVPRRVARTPVGAA